MTLERRIGTLYEEIRVDLYRYVLTSGKQSQAAQALNRTASSA